MRVVCLPRLSSLTLNLFAESGTNASLAGPICFCPSPLHSMAAPDDTETILLTSNQVPIPLPWKSSLLYLYPPRWSACLVSSLQALRSPVTLNLSVVLLNNKFISLLEICGHAQGRTARQVGQLHLGSLRVKQDSAC